MNVPLLVITVARRRCGVGCGVAQAVKRTPVASVDQSFAPYLSMSFLSSSSSCFVHGCLVPSVSFSACASSASSTISLSTSSHSIIVSWSAHRSR
jgi:hypothetical protein